MSGYSGTPLPQKLGIKDGARVRLCNKVCAIDETWSGLRFVVRLADRRPQQTRSAAAGRRG